MAEKKDYGKLVKALQIVTGVIMLALVVVGIILMKKYNINAKNIPELSEKLSAFANGTLIVVLWYKQGDKIGVRYVRLAR